MKKSILALTTTAFLTGSILISCSSSTEKVEKAQTNVIEANNDLDKANEEYLADVEKYRNETAEKIAANNQSITEFKARVESEKKEAKADYKQKIAELEQKNNDMKMRMDDYKAEGKEKWETFKSEFSHDMDEMGKAFKDLTVKNVNSK